MRSALLGAIILVPGLAAAQGVPEAQPTNQLPTITVKPDAPPKKPVTTAPTPKSSPSASTAQATPAATSSPQASADASSIAVGPIEPPTTSSQFIIPRTELLSRPVTRPGEILEATPGLIVTQHSGDGKANQYFLRGYNLDHGTDLAIFVDDMPINMPTHGHGQGYSDLNWLIPETVSSLDVRKGPYFPDVGDFGTTGNLHIGLTDSFQGNLAQTTVGSFGYLRVLGMSGVSAGPGRVLAAVEAGQYDGPWTHPDDMKKLNGLLRYSQGTALDGFSITGMAYTNKWNSTDQVPERAINSGLLDRFGSEDPTDGGQTSRFSLSARYASSDATGYWKSNAYVVKSKLDLFNDFTYFLSNPTQGDQFHQHDDRLVAGGGVSRTEKGTLGGFATETTIGAQTRFDDISVALTDTFQRSFLSNVRSDYIREGNVGVYIDETLHWTPWLKTSFGWRGDYFAATNQSVFDANNSGSVEATKSSPKFRLVLGPFAKTEFFLSAGYGMHSNDVRGATITESPTDPTTKLSASPLLVQTRGAEVGFRTRAISGLESTVSLFELKQDSELIFNGDGGDTSASRASSRYGVEWTNEYRPYSWLAFDADLAFTHARFDGYDSDQAAVYASLAGYPSAQAGNAPGNYIPNAPEIVASAGITAGGPQGWFGTLRWRYLGVSPLTEDNYFKSPPTSIFNGRVGYRFDDGWTAALDGLNLLNTKTNQITYAYGSLLKTDNLFTLCNSGSPPPSAVCQNGVMDRVLHPIEPLAVRFTLSKQF